MTSAPILGDEAIDSLLRLRHRSETVSIRGEPGTGKSLLMAQLLATELGLGRSASVHHIGQAGEGQQFLNQSMGIHIDLYRFLQTRSLRLFELLPLRIEELISHLSESADPDICVLDSADRVVGDLNDVELVIASVLREAGRTSVIVSRRKDTDVRPEATVQIDMVRTGQDVVRAAADAILIVRRGEQEVRRALRVGATEIYVWSHG